MRARDLVKVWWRRPFFLAKLAATLWLERLRKRLEELEEESEE